MAAFSIDVKDLPTEADLLIQPGWYTATIKAVDLNPSKSGGVFLKVTYNITGPTDANSTVNQYINIKNANEKAEKMGRVMLGNILKALGLTVIEDTDELIGLDLDIEVAIKAGTGTYRDSNDVKKVRALSGVAYAPNWE